MSRVFWVRHGPTHAKSMVGWSNAGYEMANVPGLFRNMINKITGKY